MSEPTTKPKRPPYRMPQVRIPPVHLEHGQLALGCWVFGGEHWAGQSAQDSRAVMEAALRRGMNHFDTAEAYGQGRSEKLVGEFLRTDEGRRERVFLASKGLVTEPTAAAIRSLVEGSLSRLGVDSIDLYYLHWPLHGGDLRPVFEELRKARDEGKIQAIGVSNFNVAQLEAAMSVSEIHAHQFCYNLLWRGAEREVIPYCVRRQVPMVTYSSIAQGILTGSFPPTPQFNPGDLRGKTVLFEPEVWPQVYAAVEKMKAVAAEAKRPLAHLAIRWLTRKAEVTSVLVGARNAVQLNELAGAMGGTVEEAVFDKLTAISDELAPLVPDAGNLFRFYP
jgi:aryl-alcohol dehydrogenase-like predicted oxidoreductase